MSITLGVYDVFGYAAPGLAGRHGDGTAARGGVHAA
jgi:hypothetical protein